MPPNSQQRLIFVYLRSKDDPKSCTQAGAKLTNEYTHRTNKNNPCTISVTPSQLCTFFRKRTYSTERIKNSSEERNDSSEVSFDSSEEFFLSSGGNPDFLGSYLGNSSGEIALVGGMYGLVIMRHSCPKLSHPLRYL